MTTDELLSAYDRQAVTYAARTFSLNLSAERQAFQRLLPAGASVLDAGCGSGRDCAAFLAEGFCVSAFDGSAALAAQAHAATGLNVPVLRFEALPWTHEFDGVWACASLVHQDPTEAKQSLAALARVLRPTGVLYASFKQGTGHSTAPSGLPYYGYALSELMALVKAAGLTGARFWQTSGQLDPEQSWWNLLAFKS